MKIRRLYLLIVLIALVGMLATCNLDSTLPSSVSPCLLDTSTLDDCLLEP